MFGKKNKLKGVEIDAWQMRAEEFMKVSETYRKICEKFTGVSLRVPENPRQEIMETIASLGVAA